MTTLQPSGWRKSSRSNGQGGACVEVGSAPGTVGIRDSKNPTGGTLVVDRAVFTVFLAAIRDR
ncbi:MULTISPECIES: DUF397 domain-containing protein [Actinoalloteichus]|uniref:DUF397 family protein n=1 Tax=Actinoalloteichus fjordicus TaxID=1612552 RepID=A0AAC9LET6_9PSEU|nr:MULTISPECIES: DUF397 domain-containing protein [Actinoalloteichus]APU16623.1 putative DUF397 family protein [Actinoalloteichus fjordicus]APU22689.1 putative DUF397 family protein [Actinoalloteichus sp. GBA129-24]